MCTCKVKCLSLKCVNTLCERLWVSNVHTSMVTALSLRGLLALASSNTTLSGIHQHLAGLRRSDPTSRNWHLVCTFVILECVYTLYAYLCSHMCLYLVYTFESLKLVHTLCVHICDPQCVYTCCEHLWASVCLHILCTYLWALTCLCLMGIFMMKTSLVSTKPHINDCQSLLCLDIRC